MEDATDERLSQLEDALDTSFLLVCAIFVFRECSSVSFRASIEFSFILARNPQVSPRASYRRLVVDHNRSPRCYSDVLQRCRMGYYFMKAKL